MQNDSYNRGGFIAFVFSMVFSLGFFAYLVLFQPGIDLKEVKAPDESVDQTIAGGGAAPKAVDVSGVTEPWKDNPDMVTHGAKVYSNNCAVCHGPKGEGNGPAGMGLNPPPRNLVVGGWKKGGDSISLYVTLEKGLPGTSMAAFAHLPSKDRWALVQFIHSITQQRVPDDAAKLEAFGKTAK